ncbi:MAG: hypothetical protein FJ386_09390 [Verrucomicrobia bacterium]|nr:hypothetical protein [Verrucomicrobiota bacterium]
MVEFGLGERVFEPGRPLNYNSPAESQPGWMALLFLVPVVNLAVLPIVAFTGGGSGSAPEQTA